MPTETDVCNLALGKIGGAGDQESGTGLIASINGVDRISARCKFLLPFVRRRVFNDLAKLKTPPKEALVFTDLGAEITTTLKMGGWEFVFTIPNNTIRVMRQIDEKFATRQVSITDKLTTYPFQIRWQDTTMLLFTNDMTNEDGDSTFIDRVFDQTNVGTWNEETRNAIATLLGSELVPTVGAVDQERETLLAEYKTVSLPDASAAIQGQDDDFPPTVKDLKGGRNESLESVS